MQNNTGNASNLAEVIGRRFKVSHSRLLFDEVLPHLKVAVQSRAVAAAKETSTERISSTFPRAFSQKKGGGGGGLGGAGNEIGLGEIRTWEIETK